MALFAYLPPIEDSTNVKPVMLPPRCARLAARPLPIGSDTVTNTIGIACVSWKSAH